MYGEMQHISSDLLDIAGIAGPPVDAFRVAAALDYEVRWDSGVESGMADAQRGIIFLNPAERPERQHFTLAHEVCEISLAECFPAEPVQERHRAAMFGASELLMPRRWFEPRMRACAANLRDLKASFTNVSHEALAYRLLRACPAVVSIFDHGMLRRRVGSRGLAYPRRHLLPAEQRLLDLVVETQADAHRQEAEIALSGYWIHEPGWPRVVLITRGEGE